MRAVILYPGINFSGVDATFFKHIIFRKGQLFLLVTRDGNNQLVILAWAVGLKEDGPNYKYFAKHCKLVIIPNTPGRPGRYTFFKPLLTHTLFSYARLASGPILIDRNNYSIPTDIRAFLFSKDSLSAVWQIVSNTLSATVESTCAKPLGPR